MNRGRPRNTNGSVYQRSDSKLWWMRYHDRNGKLHKESTGTTVKDEAEQVLRARLTARDEGRLSALLAGEDLTFNAWADWFLKKRSQPPYRAAKTHQDNLEALKLLRPAFGELRLQEIAPEAIEDYIEDRLASGRRVHTKFGIEHRGQLKPATVHKEFRILRRILNVAVKKKRLAVNPCSAVEFPVRINGTTRKPHYMTASEQARIEFFAPAYLKNAIRILVEMGLRPYKELTPIRKEQIDLANMIVHVPESKTPNGIADMPMTEVAKQALIAQMQETPDSEYLFPTPRKGAKTPYIRSLKKAWASTLERAGVPHFPIYHLRHTFATRLSAGGVADHFVTQMLRQGDAAVFKRYSHAKLNMMREALGQIDRQANEHEPNIGTAKPN